MHCGLQGQPLRGSARLAGHDLTAGPHRLGQDPGVAYRIVDLPGGTGIGVKLAQRPAAERGQPGDLVADGEGLLEAAHQRVDGTRLLQGLPGPVTVTGGQGGRDLFQGVGEPVEHGLGGLVDVLDGIQGEQHLAMTSASPPPIRASTRCSPASPPVGEGVAARKIAARLAWTTSTRLPLISRASVMATATTTAMPSGGLPITDPSSTATPMPRVTPSTSSMAWRTCWPRVTSTAMTAPMGANPACWWWSTAAASSQAIAAAAAIWTISHPSLRSRSSPA